MANDTGRIAIIASFFVDGIPYVLDDPAPSECMHGCIVLQLYH